MHYWKDKVYVWGEEKAYREIRLSDFEKEDMKSLALGGQQLLKDRDAFGRKVVIYDRSRIDNRVTHRKSTVRKTNTMTLF
jgi:hypothetical protein